MTNLKQVFKSQELKDLIIKESKSNKTKFTVKIGTREMRQITNTKTFEELNECDLKTLKKLSKKL